jgi:molybdate transport system regulatory protein
MSNVMKTGGRKKQQRGMNVRPRVKLWFELEGERAFCPGVCGILRAIEATGSIKEAAVSIGRSYRFVWGKIKQVEHELGCPIVETRVGGVLEQRSVLTPAGEVLVSQFETLRRELFDFVDNKFAPRLQAALSRLENASVPQKR